MVGVTWKLAARNLLRNRRRNLIAMTAVVLGFLGISLFVDYVLWAETYMTTNSVYLNHNGHVLIVKPGALEDFGANPKRFLITKAEQDAVTAILTGDRRVEFVGQSLKGMGLLDADGHSVPFVAQGVDITLEKALRTHPQVMRWNAELVAGDRDGAIWQYDGSVFPVALTKKLARLVGLGAKLDRRAVQLIGATFDGKLSVVDGDLTNHFSTGLALNDDTALMTSLNALQRLYDTDGVTAIAVYLKDRSALFGFRRDLERTLHDQGLRMEALSYRDERVSPFYVGVVSFIGAAAIFFLITISVVVVIALGSTMSMAVVERSREVGMLRAMGFRDATVRGLFLKEAALMVLCGTAVGFALNHIVAVIVNDFSNLRFAPPGIAGSTKFLVVPNGNVSAVLAIVFVTVGAYAVGQVVRRQTKATVATLLSSSGR